MDVVKRVSRETGRFFLHDCHQNILFLCTLCIIITIILLHLLSLLKLLPGFVFRSIHLRIFYIIYLFLFSKGAGDCSEKGTHALQGARFLEMLRRKCCTVTTSTGSMVVRWVLSTWGTSVETDTEIFQMLVSKNHTADGT